MEWDIANGKIRVNPQTLMLAKFREFYDADESLNKEESTDVFMYIYLCSQTDDKAPFFTARLDEVGQLARNQVWYHRECPFDLDLFTPLIEEYKESKSTPDHRILKIYNHKIDQLQVTINGITPTVQEVKDSRGNFRGYATNMGMLTTVMKELNKLLDERDKLKNRISKVSADSAAFRAGKSENLLERRIKSTRNARTRTNTGVEASGTGDEQEGQASPEVLQ